MTVIGITHGRDSISLCLARAQAYRACTMKCLTCYLCLLVTAACSKNAHDQLEPADAAVDSPSSTDANNTATLLVGTWVGCDTPQNTYLFSEDASFRYCEAGDCLESGAWDREGTYTAESGLLTLSATTEEGVEVDRFFSYHANENTFMPGAFLPQGAHEGIVGTWSSLSGEEALGQTNQVRETVSLNSDMSATATYADSQQSLDAEGTWGPNPFPESDGEFTAQLMTSQGPWVIPFDLVDEIALGTNYYCRSEAQ